MVQLWSSFQKMVYIKGISSILLKPSINNPNNPHHWLKPGKQQVWKLPVQGLTMDCVVQWCSSGGVADENCRIKLLRSPLVQVCWRRSHHLLWVPQHGCPHHHVLLLLHECHGSQCSEVSLVEEVGRNSCFHLQLRQWHCSLIITCFDLSCLWLIPEKNVKCYNDLWKEDFVNIFSLC